MPLDSDDMAVAAQALMNEASIAMDARADYEHAALCYRLAGVIYHDLGLHNYGNAAERKKQVALNELYKAGPKR